MTIKIYGVPFSGNTQRVILVCREKNVPFEIIPVDILTGELKSDAFKEKQPFGQMPYIDDDGFILYESRAIAAYITAKYADQGTQGLIPSDPKAHALYEQAISVEMCHFDPNSSVAGYELFMKKKLGREPDVARGMEHLATLAGDEITLADLYHLPGGERLHKVEVGIFEKWPNVSRWWKDISSRPAWVAMMAPPA